MISVLSILCYLFCLLYVICFVYFMFICFVYFMLSLLSTSCYLFGLFFVIYFVFFMLSVLYTICYLFWYLMLPLLSILCYLFCLKIFFRCNIYDLFSLSFCRVSNKSCPFLYGDSPCINGQDFFYVFTGLFCGRSLRVLGGRFYYNNVTLYFSIRNICTVDHGTYIIW